MAKFRSFKEELSEEELEEELYRGRLGLHRGCSQPDVSGRERRRFVIVVAHSVVRLRGV